MPVVLFLFVKLIVEAVRAATQRTRTAKPQPLCADCVFAHVQYGADGRRAISCTYGGTVRPVMLDVLYCTDYRDRNAPPRRARVGFVCEIRKVEAEA
jgi:hypothetical protein